MNWDNSATVAFLKEWSLNGPWAITAIPTTTSDKLAGRIFRPGDEPELELFLDKYGKEKRNLYFSVNQVNQKEFRVKASRETIERVTHLHVDIDPRAGEPLAEEQARILKLSKNMPEGLPEPTWVIFSGGGYQLYWELAEPIEVNGSMELAERAKLYNLQIEVQLKADNCHNVDRIMRLPGTINVPDHRKKLKGRVPALSYVVVHNADNIYQINQFTPAAQVEVVDTGFASTTKVEISANIERAKSIDDIAHWARAANSTLPDWLKMLILQGDDPDDHTKYPSRSEALFACLLGLCSAQLTDNQIYAIITDPDWGISASVLDKGSGQERYAKRQIQRAREYSKSPELLELNEKHAVIASYGGKCVVIQEIWDPHLCRFNLVKQSFGDFKNRYMNKRVQVGTDNKGKPKYSPMGKWWLEHSDRRQYTNIVFSPLGQCEDAYNLWRGFACEAIPGDCSLYLDHMLNVVCSGNKVFFDYLLNWMARAVQFPDRAGEAAVILRGRQGTGKSILVKHFGALFGRHFLQVSDSKHLVGSFNQHLRDCIVLFGDEAFFAGDKKHEGVLKTLVTEQFLMSEAKGVDAEVTPNYLHIIMASNSDWVVPAGLEERRFFVLDVNEKKMQNTVYFKALTDQMDNGGREALLHKLKTTDLSEFNHRDIPQTDALYEQKQLSMSPEHEWWYDKLIHGTLLPDHDGEWKGVATLTALFNDYTEYLSAQHVFRKQSKTILGKFLRKVNPPGRPRHRMVTWPNEKGGQSKQYVWEFPNLADARGYWDSRFLPGEWPTEQLPTEKTEPY